MRQFLLCLVLLALGLFTPQSTSAFLLHGGGSPGLPYHGPCDDISGGCAETWNFQRAAANSYSGALFRLTNTSNSATLDIVQDGSRKADMTTWSAFCGGTNTTTNGISVNSVCVISKIYAQIHGSANDLVPAVFNAPFGPDCSTGGALVCACPFAVEVATGLPILKSTPPCEYTIASDANATGITAGTSSLSLFYEGIAQAATYCCGPAGIGHAWNAADDFGTTFYLSVAQGQFSFSSGNECQTSTSYCSGLDEESIGDLVDYSPTNIGSVFAAGAFNAGTNTVSSYINGGQVRSPITPAAGALHRLYGDQSPAIGPYRRRRRSKPASPGGISRLRLHQRCDRAERCQRGLQQYQDILFWSADIHGLCRPDYGCHRHTERGCPERKWRRHHEDAHSW